MAILELIGSVPARAGGDGDAEGRTSILRRPTDLQRALGVHSKLAWQVHRFAHASNPLAEATNLPGSSALRRLLDAAKRRGVPGRSLDAVRQAQSALEQLIRIHAGTRGAFDSMVGELIDGGSDHVDLLHRRAAFRANSHILGVQARSQFCCFAARPSDQDPGFLDVVSIRGLLDLKRMRTNVSAMISTTRLIDDDGNVLGGRQLELLDPEDPASNPAGMIRRFCSQPLPKFSTATAPDGYVNVDLEGDVVGNLSAITCIDGYVWRSAVSRWADEHNRRGSFSCTIRNPLEVAIVDVLMHESAYKSLALKPVLFSDHRRTDQPSRDRGLDVLPLREPAVYLGRGAAALHTPDVPRYVEVAEYAFGRLGWSDGEFDVYRCRVEYPFMPASLRLHYDLPRREQF